SGFLMGWFHAEALAAHQIALNIATLSFMIAMGTSFGVSVRTGHALGENNVEKARVIGVGAFSFTVLFMSIFAVIFISGRDFFPQFYVDDPKVLKLASQFLVVAAFFQLFDGVQAIGVGALRGVQDARGTTLITLSAY